MRLTFSSRANEWLNFLSPYRESESHIRVSKAVNVTITDDAIVVDLSDGRTITAPLVWYPRLLQGNQRERNNWRLIGDGNGIHWQELDEDISVENIIFGQPSGESPASFKRWLEKRVKN